MKYFLIKLINLYLKLGSIWRSFIYSKYYYCLFRLNPAIHLNGRLLVTGRLLLKIDPMSQVNIKGFLRINSGYKTNPFFGERKTIINVNRNGVLDIGDYVGISNSSIYCSKKIVIEDNVMIGGGCQIYDSNFHKIDFEARIKLKENTAKTAPVLVKNGAFIGGGSHICKGVTIGQRSVIASGSVVICDIPDDQIWGGNPAVFIKHTK
jgi:acetyltransferase-like isoleucine patch superfamily enzyme